MLQFLRKIVASRLGALVVIGLLVLIALAFAGSGVGSMRNALTGSSDSALVTVGGEPIDAADVRLAANSALDNARQGQPTLSMQGFVAAGGLDQVIDNLVDRAAMVAWGRRHGVVAGDRLVDSEIAKIPAFLGPDGKFSQSQFQALISQRGVSEALVRRDVTQSLVGRELMVPAGLGAAVPGDIALRYAQLLRESRAGTIVALPAALFAPQAPPDAAALDAWYAGHRGRFIRPERRTVRYAVLDTAALKAVAAPSEAEITARYAADAPRYAAQETRTLTQVIVPSEAVAKAVAAEVAGGKPLAGAAQARGLAPSTLGPLAKTALVGQTSQAVADAAFAAAKGAVAAPARSELGWHVVHVDQIVVRPARTLAQAHDEIAVALAVDKRRKALADTSAKVEDEFDGGSSIADVAKALGLTLARTDPLTADGAVYAKPGARPPAVLARVLKTAFGMEQENEPQIAEVDPGKTFVLFDVARIDPSAPAPLAEISGDATLAYMLDRGSAAAGDAARKVLAALKQGTPLPQALAAAGRPLPPPQQVAMSREQVAAMQQQTRQPVPPPLGLLFSMAQGTAKLLPMPQDRGWYLVTLRQIVPGALAPNDPLLASARGELGQAAGDEYGAALRRAMRDEVGVKRNDAAIAALRRQLGGNGGGGGGDQ